MPNLYFLLVLVTTIVILYFSIILSQKKDKFKRELYRKFEEELNLLVNAKKYEEAKQINDKINSQYIGFLSEDRKEYIDKQIFTYKAEDIKEEIDLLIDEKNMHRR